ncbi:phosphonate metabolism protein/1,5-bisphosphokinase (PRPP-forming) PhnN [Roseibium sp. RKSG952]|uniref:phosphonate metabolism protein/1,5-bisphosphokinase (PRPP-forming) PhnN n=1 Tax=Roseibium sp. RKSG952 TaxID=2529384 RepID=UPI001AD8E724|nr:phosphonate metabolism protein/1,5-bisphosphokinase (PRPP-forming) PhnN [Roseibium sp. RKSG952]
MPETPQTGNPDGPVSNGKAGPGRLVLIVGPSGAGKDTLIAGLKADLAGRSDIHFARRQVTRPADADSEDHDTLSEDAYAAVTTNGNCALFWRAHGLGYVLPQTCDDVIRRGGTVIANGARRALHRAFEKYAHVDVVLITAPIPVLAERLAARGRESKAQIEARLTHADLEPQNVPGLIRIENTGTIKEGVAAMRAALSL